MIDGLKLTMTGEQLIARLNERIEDHEANIRYYENVLKDPQRNAEGAFPRRACEGEVATSRRRIAALTLIRDHILRNEVYLLGEFDLRFADLVSDDDWVDCGCLGSNGETRYPEVPEDVSVS